MEVVCLQVSSLKTLEKVQALNALIFGIMCVGGIQENH